MPLARPATWRELRRATRDCKLEERMLYPGGAKSTVTVTLASGEKISGTLAYLDEFTVALRDTTARTAHGRPTA